VRLPALSRFQHARVFVQSLLERDSDHARDAGTCGGVLECLDVDDLFILGFYLFKVKKDKKHTRSLVSSF
jgi:hypothetical protein